MRTFTPPAPLQHGSPELIQFSVEMGRVLQEVADYAGQLSVVERPWATPCNNQLLLGMTAAAPGVVDTGAGSVTGSFDYASSFKSTSLRMETILSATTGSGVVANRKLTITGAESTDPQVDLVCIWRRPTGGTEAEWLLVAEVPNTGGAGWTYDDEFATSSLIVDPRFPMDFRWGLWTVCGPRWYLRRVKLWFESDYEPDPAAYWQFQLKTKMNGQVAYSQITKPQTTEATRLTSQWVVNVPQANAVAQPLTPILNLPIPENATVVLSARGFGSVTPLPRFHAQVDAYRKEP